MAGDVQSRMTVFLFTDIVDSTAIQNRTRGLEIYRKLGSEQPGRLAWQSSIAEEARELARLHGSQGPAGKPGMERALGIERESLSRLAGANGLLPEQKKRLGELEATRAGR
jgi:hypothetical protein